MAAKQGFSSTAAEHKFLHQTRRIYSFMVPLAPGATKEDEF